MKALGLSLVFLSCFLAGAVKAWGKRDRLARERSCVELLRHVKQTLEATLCPRSRLFEGFSSPLWERTGVLAQLQRGADPYKLCQTHREVLGLREESFQNLCEFFSTLGKVEYQEQLRRCGEHCQRAERLLEELEKKEKDAAVLCLTLGAAAGAFAVILLV